MTYESNGMELDEYDIFISYAISDEKWAVWVAAQLSSAGYTVRYMAKDSYLGVNFVGQMHRAVSRARRTIALYSVAYLASKYCEAEWTAAWSMGKLLVFRIEEQERIGLFAPMVMDDLFDLDEPVARQRLLDSVRLEVQPTATGGPIVFDVIVRSGCPRFPGFGTVDRWIDDMPLPVATKTAQLLADTEASGLTAVDDAILIYGSGRNQKLDDIEIRFRRKPQETTIDDPLESDLERIIQEAALDPETVTYLRRVAHLGAWNDLYRAKVRLCRIDYERSIPARPMRLQVAPLSQWIERQFNRKILSHLGRDEQLKALYDRHREQVVRSWLDSDLDSVEISAPNVLYFEVCTVSADGRVLIAKKRGAGGGSGYAKSGRPWTCPLETGLEWEALRADGHFDFRSSLEAGANREIKIEPHEIRTVEWTGIAIEGHLNSALLGVMHVDVEESDLLARLGGSSDYDSSSVVPEFVDVTRIPERIFGQAQDGIWHTTARLRILLYLLRGEGPDRVRDLLNSARSSE